MTKSINAAAVPVTTDDVDDFCSCYGSIYHSFIDPVDSTPPFHPLPEPQPDVPSEPLLSASMDLMDPMTLKAQRSTECARQRLKKPMDVAKSKRHPVTSCSYCRPYKVAKSALRSPEAHRVLRYDVTEAKVDAKLVLERNRDLTETAVSTPIPMRNPQSVSLLDLMKPPSRSAEKRFEIVNRPRQVLALDDFTEIDVDRYDLDDWEHIPAPNPRKSSRRSYAKVVAAKA